jgi:hypothetical protein
MYVYHHVMACANAVMGLLLLSKWYNLSWFVFCLCVYVFGLYLSFASVTL